MDTLGYYGVLCCTVGALHGKLLVTASYFWVLGGTEGYWVVLGCTEVHWEVTRGTVEYCGVLHGTTGYSGGTRCYCRVLEVLWGTGGMGVIEGSGGYSGVLWGTGATWGC